jgi:hypothetical protein
MHLVGCFIRSISYYFQFQKRLFSHFFELKIGVRLKFEEIFCTLLQSLKHRFPRTRRLAKRVANFTGSEMYLLKTPIFMKISL